MTEKPNPDSDPNLSDLRRAMLGGGSGSGASGSRPSGPWIPPSPEQLQVLLPQYQILTMLGRGGMGAVYMGKQLSLDRPVAIKILSGALEESDLGFKERFKNEARAMAKLSHPGIVAVHDFGETADGLLYIVMEYIEGTDVARMIAAEGRLHTEYAMAITAHVCDALAYAHERGIIHRDIKPANIMVGYDGVVKVADFGLAKVHGGEGQTLGLTMSGMAMGTMHFMAPEALEHGVIVDHRADLYAVGVMLYQMLTGKVPRGMFEMPSLQMAGLDPRYDGIIAKAMREDREVRYQSARDLRADLDGILTQPVEKVEAEDSEPAAALPTMARPKRPGGKGAKAAASSVRRKSSAKSSGSGMIWAVLGVTALLGAGVGYWLYSNRDRGEGVPETADKAPPVSVLTTAATPEEATKERPFVNSLGMKFVPVPGTDVLFCIHETRYQDYEAYAKENPGTDESWRNQTTDRLEITDQAEEHPVLRVSWQDAKEFCAWLGQKEGVSYRLPTDEEWSFAVGLGGKEIRSPADTPETLNGKVLGEYPWGGGWPPPAQAGNYSDQSRKNKAPREGSRYLINYDDSWPTTAPVMSYPPNRFGLHDLGGNVWELVEDWLNETQEARATRGGSWNAYQESTLGSSWRGGNRPEHRGDHTGFRVVLIRSVGSPANSPPSTPPSTSTTTPIAATATKEAPFENTLGMKFVPVPGTDVLFCIHETRYRDYAAYATKEKETSWKIQTNDGFEIERDAEDHPVTRVNWDDAQKFCNWLSEKEGKTYRLPTDQEWSLAAGIGREEEWKSDTTPETVSKPQDVFPWGDEWPPPPGAGNYSDESRRTKAPRDDAKYLDGYDDGFPTTAPVMSFAASEYGPFDLGGNVWEWCDDWFSGERKERVLRGASWGNDGRGGLLSASRHRSTPDFRDNRNGFRVVLEATTPSQSSVSTPTPSQGAPGMATSSADAPSPPSTPDQLPDVRSRIANYQKTRQTQLSDLTEKYRVALVAAREAAPGDRASFEAEIAAASARAANIAELANEVEPAPLPPMPALHEGAPDRLKELREIFVTEVSKIESALIASLDQSLASVQTTLVQAEKPTEARAVEEFRSRMMKAFVASETGVALTTDAPNPAESAVNPVSVGSTPFPTPRLVDVRRIWNEAAQNQYTDLIFHNGSWLCVFSESAQNSATSKGSIRVIGSPDGNEWSTLALISDPDFDLRDPKITVAPDGRLMLNSGGKIPRNRNFIQSKTWFSSNGGSIWSAADDIGEQGFWLWRVVPHDDALYSIGYSTPLLNPPRLYRSRDGKNYESFVSALALPPTSTEGSLLFRSDGSSIALVRHDTGDKHSFVGSSSPPYNSWSWRQLDRQVGGPNLIELPSGHILVAGRFYEPDQHMALHWLSLGTDHVEREECLRLPSAIQTGYPGLVWENDLLWVSYYSSHEGSPSIYLARVAFTDSTAPSNPVAAASPVNPPVQALPINPSVSANLYASTKDQTFVNSLGMKFVHVPGTKVLFCIHETRRKDFAAFAAQNTSVGGNWKIPVLNDSPLVGEPFDQHPVAKVSRDDAESFCKWLSGQSQYSYRLPTDEEWSKAAGFDEPRTSADTPYDLNNRAVSGTAARIYPWGTEWPPPADAGNYSGEFTSDSDNFPTTSPVMSFDANKYGLHDLGGNVWEWVSDQYWNKDALFGTLRGGGWDTDREWPRRSGSRFGEHRNVGAAIFGFRVVLELP